MIKLKEKNAATKIIGESNLIGVYTIISEKF